MSDSLDLDCTVIESRRMHVGEGRSEDAPL